MHLTKSMHLTASETKPFPEESRNAGHDLHLPSHPLQADLIIAHRADSAADASAVTVIGVLTASGRKMSSETAF
jgi:hypothetical protein